MEKEELIEELKKIPDVAFCYKYISLSGPNKSIEWDIEKNILTNYASLSPMATNDYDNLLPETILDLFRKWKS